MAVIDAVGGLQITRQMWTPAPKRTALRFYDSFNYEYAELYRLQPNIRTCVDFLARNIAQLGLHQYRRASDTDRVRLTDYPMTQLLAMPLPATYKMTRYRLIESLMGDLGIYFNAYWLKIRQDGEVTALLRVPPSMVVVVGGLVPTGYEITVGGRMREFAPTEIVHFRGYNPENATSGLSPLETLRRILAEEHSAGKYREGFWQNAARQNGVIKRPLNAPSWSDTARERFTAEFEELYSGDDNSGKTAVLEEGMEWQPITFNAQESEYLAGRKLTREECARAYHIPLPMVGILDNATFSNVREQHKHLYQDSLGPWLAMIEQDIDLQLLPDFEDNEGIYSEFNIAQKLQGDFEEQVKSLQSAVGRPYMTANEARAKLNLPSMGGDADALVTPLNVLVGGQASPRDSAPKELQSSPEGKGSKVFAREHQKASFGVYAPEMRERHVAKWAETLAEHYRRQERALAGRVLSGGAWYDAERWNRELGQDLLKLNVLTSGAWVDLMATQTGVAADRDSMMAWLDTHSQIQATGINEQTESELRMALDEPDALEAVQKVFLAAITVWAWRQARTGVTAASSFGANEGARAGGLKMKTWRTHNANSRDSHAAQNGMSIPIGQRFPNGQKWPGDPAGGADENAGCECSVEFG